MKHSKIIFLIAFVFLISSGFHLSETFSQENENAEIKETKENPFGDYKVTQNHPKAIIHVILRDADGNLVGYAQGHEWYRIRPNLLNPILDGKSVTETFTFNGTEYEKISFYHKTERLIRDYSYAGYILWSFDGNGGKTSALFMNHEAYQSKPGDTIEVYYTFYRPTR